jgi:hypothetical protein
MTSELTGNYATPRVDRPHDNSALISLYPPSPYGKVAVEKNGFWSLKQRVLISRAARARMSENQSFLLSHASRNRCKDVPRIAEPVAVRQYIHMNLVWTNDILTQLSYQVAVKLSGLVPGELGTFIDE